MKHFLWVTGFVSLVAASCATAAEPTLGKGTIGLACTNSKGLLILWNTERAADFEGCLNEVIQDWAETNATPANPEPAGDTDGSNSSAVDLIRGMETYRKVLLRGQEGESVQNRK